MKDEIAFEIAGKDDFGQVKALVDDWMDYYNTERYQWSLAKLSPQEYYRYVTTGFYPLQEYKK
jgi:transposase InsO family protein